VSGPYKIGTLSRLTGFSPALLRTWERRFDLLAPGRGPGGQRLYDDDDLRVLNRVRALIDQGRSIGEIARSGRETLLAQASIDQGPSRQDGTGTDDRAAATAEWRRRITAGALALDVRTVSATLDEVFAALAPGPAIDEVIEPVAFEVGRLWAAGDCSVASEHLVSDQFLHRIRRLLDATQPASDSPPRAVAACFPDEHHQLGLAILSWQLARRGVRIVYLGPALPLDDLVRGCEAARPRAVLLSVARSPIFKAHHASIRRLVADGSLAAPVVLGGQGVPERFRRADADGAVVYAPGSPLPEVVERILTEVRSKRPDGLRRARTGQ
jgi:DNA-binding transcriptional MerR regulator/methylmalonyl-CoA mutase cobalamin-binding subunit